MFNSVRHLRSKRLGSSSGVVLMQAVNSVTTLLHVALFAIVLPREVFDEYAVWITSSMFAVGLAQAIGSERVVIGRRSREDGMSSAWAVALVILLVQAGVALWLGNMVLVACSVGAFMWAVWDYLRIVEGFTMASTFLRNDIGVVGAQIVAVVIADALGMDSAALPLVWWGLGSVLWLGFASRMGMTKHRARSGGFRVLWTDRRESTPLLLDAALAGVPIVLALAVAQATGAEGDASAARMAFTILGPIAVLGMAGRRIVYAARAQGGFTARTRTYFTGALAVVFLTCFGLLALTRTPLYPLVFPGFEGLALVAIAGFSLNHAAVLAAMLPAADLRAEQRSILVGVARICATLTAVGFVLVVSPFDTVTDVAWCVTFSSLVYAVMLYLLQIVRPVRPAPEAPTQATLDQATLDQVRLDRAAPTQGAEAP